MASINLTGKDPQGTEQSIPNSGPVMPPFQGIVPNGGNKSSDWFNTNLFNGLGFIFVSNKSGYYTLEYSEDKTSLFVPIITVQYNGDDVGFRRKGVVDQDAQWARLIWYNNSGSDSTLSMRVMQKVGLFQPSLETLGATGAFTRLGQWVKAFLHIPDATGAFGDVQRTGNSLNVNVTSAADNGTDATVAAPLAGATGLRGWLSSIFQYLKNGLQTTQIVDGNNVPYGTTAKPFNVNVNNFPASTEIANDVGNPIPVIGTITVGNFPTTQPISAATLPLPTNAAQEANGNLAAIATATGTKADAAVTDSTLSASQIALLKGMLFRLSNPLTTVSVPTSTGGYPNKAIYQPAGTAGSFTLIATGVRKLGSINITNTSGSTISITLYDKATAPVVADNPAQMYAVPNGQTMAVELGDGLHFNNGIGIGGIVGANLGSLLGGLLTGAISAGTVSVSYAYV